jgi:hypothetical protein
MPSATTWDPTTPTGALSAWRGGFNPSTSSSANSANSSIIPAVLSTNSSTQNDDAILAALVLIKAAGGGQILFPTPGQYLISATPLLGDNTDVYLAPGVELKIASGAACNFFRNEQWASTPYRVTLILPAGIVGATGQYNLVLSTLAPFAVGEYAYIKGDINGVYDGIHRVIAIQSGVSITVRLSFSLANIPYPTLIAGTTPLSIIGYIMTTNYGTGFLNARVGTPSQPAFTSFIAPVSGGTGLGAMVQFDVRNTGGTSGTIISAHVAEPGYGYQFVNALTVDLTAGGGSAGVALSTICTPCCMTVAKANWNINIFGGSFDWNIGNVGGPGQLLDGTTRHGFVFNRVGKLNIQRPHWVHVDLYAVAYANIDGMVYENATGEPANFGQGIGPVRNINYRNMKGATQDDAMAISVNNGADPTGANDYSYLDLPDCNGMINGFKIDGVDLYGAGNCVSIFGGRGFPVRGVRLRSVTAISGLPNSSPGNLLVANCVEGSAGTYNITTNSSVSGLVPGMFAYGSGLAVNSKIVSVTVGSPSTITIDIAISSQNPSQTLAFVHPAKGKTRCVTGVTIGALGAGDCLIEDVEIDGFSGDVGSSLISVSQPQVGGTLRVNKLTFKGLKNFAFRAFNPYILVSSGVTVDAIDGDDSIFRFNTSSSVTGETTDNNRAVIQNYGIVKDINLGRCKSEAVGSGSVSVTWIWSMGGSTLGRANLSQCKAEDLVGYGTTYFVQHDSANRSYYGLSNSQMVNGAALVSGAQGFDFSLSNVRCDGSTWSYPALRMYPSGMVYKAAVANVQNNTGNALVTDGGNTYILQGGDASLQIDGAKVTVASSQKGIQFYNTNVSFSTGIGVYGITGAGAASTKLF